MHPKFITLPKRAKDITGQRFNRLVALGPIQRDKIKRIIWLCQCDCGNEAIVAGFNLRDGQVQSCGCIHREQLVQRNTTHGLSKHPLYNKWTAMVRRCTNPNVTNYPHYGGRGISICNEWRHDFQSFHDYVTQLPHYGEKGRSLDRIGNDGNYEPGNVRWASRQTQTRNTRQNAFLTYQGETKTVAEWSEQIGIKAHTIRTRIRRGWSVEKALTAPPDRS